jgi:CRISPR-associated protein Csm5
MKYKVTALTPLLVGDGRQLAPIDYMVWKDQVNVLDQPRIFKLLSRGPRLEGYLGQLKKADKLDFAAWGGFAQNFSERRIPFEHSSSTAIWEKTPAEFLFIPTFAANHQGPYLPASAIKGALRTALVFTRWSSSTIEKLAASLESERLPRKLAEPLETSAGATQVRILAVGDSTAIARSSLKIFLTRVANLDLRPGAPGQVMWKMAGRGNVPDNRIVGSTPTFTEMAIPGTEFSGYVSERKFLEDPQFLKALGWRSSPDLQTVGKAANAFATAILDQHAKFADNSGLLPLQQSVAKLRSELDASRNNHGECLLCLGWGGGFLSKSSFLETENESFRKLIRNMPALGRAFKGGTLFPKTRRIVFAGAQPVYLPGWVKLKFEA